MLRPRGTQCEFRNSTTAGRLLPLDRATILCPLRGRGQRLRRAAERQAMKKSMRDEPPILSNKDPRQVSVFTPEALLREARRQKGIASGSIPALCILDPDGD